MNLESLVVESGFYLMLGLLLSSSPPLFSVSWLHVALDGRPLVTEAAVPLGQRPMFILRNPTSLLQ